MGAFNKFHSDFQSIPVFDLGQFQELQGNSRSEYARDLRIICHEVGFFYISNSGVSKAFTSRIFELTKAFFDLPQTEKDKVSISKSTHFRGYGRLLEEMTEGLADFKETFDLGLEQNVREDVSEDSYFRLQGPNQWPVSPHLLQLKWKETILEYIRQMQKVGQQIMEVLSLGLGLPENSFLEKFCSTSDDSYALLRLLKYPPTGSRVQPSTPTFGVGPHIDSGCLVLLLQDEVGGLQVQNSRGDWIDAPPIPDTFVVNIGKMLQVWSNHYFLATPHRVLSHGLKTRYSVPFFFEPRLTTEVRPLKLPPELLKDVQRGALSSEEAVVYGDHMLKVFRRSFPKATAQKE